MATLTPMMQQYFKMKEKHPESILFFRLGDFYEMFHQDAVTVAKELNLTLTSRDRNKPEKERTPMCGIPFHASEGYIAKLVSKGYKVAICEQMEDPSQAKGIVERDVIRVVSPGTVMESSMLSEGENNFFASVYCPTLAQLKENPQDATMALAFVDISTGSIAVKTTVIKEGYIGEICNELARFAPKELLISSGAVEQKWLVDYIKVGLSAGLQEGNNFLPHKGRKAALEQFGEENIPESESLLCCFGGLFAHLHETQKTDLSYLSSYTSLKKGDYLELDLVACRNLELTETLWNREKKGSLLWVMDKTKTAMGGRLLQSWLKRPLYNLYEINLRHEAVGNLKENPQELGCTMENLKKMPDLERIMARITFGNGGAKELRGLGEGLEQVERIKKEVAPIEKGSMKEIGTQLQPLPELTNLLLTALRPEQPVTVREGNMIAEGFHEEVDKLRYMVEHGEQLILALAEKTKEETGIKGLKVSFTGKTGYFFKVPATQMEEVPKEWIRRRSTSKEDRYVSDALKELEDQLLSAQDQLHSLEFKIYESLKEEVCKHSVVIQKTAEAIAQLDVLCSFAFVASENNYILPKMTENGELIIKDGRHPVVEMLSKDSLFVPNDTNFHKKNNVCSVITGPNMAGKSTYMRQVATIVIMAQIGSYVPASSATIGIVDRIFTRIGASDDLAGGKSTFMVEMSEVADLLSNATPQSLLILDEIGRGTSTFDGMAMAKAVLEHCRTKIGAKTLFATHYHELSAVSEELEGVANFHIAAKQKGDQILFLRKIVSGGADQSYGIQVAKLAGVPDEVISRAHQILAELEAGEGKPVIVSTPSQTLLTQEEEIQEKIIEMLKNVDLNELSPRNAMELVCQWQEML